MKKIIKQNETVYSQYAGSPIRRMSMGSNSSNSYKSKQSIYHSKMEKLLIMSQKMTKQEAMPVARKRKS